MVRWRPFAEAVLDVPSAIAVTRVANAQANSKKLIMLLTNFVFIFSLSCLAFHDFSLCRLRSALAGSGVPWRNHFWPFTEVQNGNQREVTGKCRTFFKQKETKTAKTPLRSSEITLLAAVATALWAVSLM